jgi:hypothetical protein
VVQRGRYILGLDLLELLVQSGLRIEASELTTLDILKRKMPDDRIYYLLHIKPSKFDRARVIPIGDWSRPWEPPPQPSNAEARRPGFWASRAPDQELWP